MTREEYIRYKVENNTGMILYRYAMDNGLEQNLDPGTFVYYMNQWIDKLFTKSMRKGELVSKQDIFNRLIGMVIEYYDIHFAIVELIRHEENKVREGFVLIM